MPRRSVALLSLLLSIVSIRAGAQTTGLRARINDLFTFGTCGQPLCLNVSSAHGNHFNPAVSAGNATLITFLTDAVGKASADVPISATSSGATFTFVAGLPVKTSTSAGPIYGERSQTLGRGRFFLGTNFTGLHFTTLNGDPLNSLVLNFKHEDVDPVGAGNYGNPLFENDLLSVGLNLDVNVLVATVAMTYGLTDFIDVGVAVPMVRTSIQGTSEASIQPYAEIESGSALHYFAGDPTNPVLTAASGLNASASGLGDVVGRIKINLGQSRNLGAALLTEVRFPTGDTTNLLGSGSAQIRVLGVTSAQFGNFAPHLNAGYVIRNSDKQNDAALVTLGFDNLMTEWATLAAGIVSEWQVGASKFQLPGPIVYDVPFRREVPSTLVPNRTSNALNATLGTKFTLRGGTVVTLNGLMPLHKAGLQPDVLWTTGLEFSF